MVKLLACLTPAKVNLFLRVVGRRADGYHLLDSIFLPVSLYDRLSLEMRPASHRSVRLRCNWEALPTDESNLAVRAAHAFLTEFGLRSQVTIELHKDIPLGAGLGGGSSDAGAVLRMMAALERIEEPERIARVASGLGADVAFFLDPRPARIGGIGDVIIALEGIPAWALVIAIPPIEVHTAEIYAALRPAQWSGPATLPMKDLAAGIIPPSMLVNDLEAVATERHPEIAQLKALLQNLGATAVAMSGSGGAVFGLFADSGSAARAALEAARAAPATRVVSAQSLPSP